MSVLVGTELKLGLISQPQYHQGPSHVILDFWLVLVWIFVISTLWVGLWHSIAYFFAVDIHC